MFYNHVFSGTRSKTLKGGGVVSGIANKDYLVGADSMSCRSFSLLPFFSLPPLSGLQTETKLKKLRLDNHCKIAFVPGA